ncbi:hypothetical protein PENTCL1PPCAC_15384, partial [Pristionchus entomophagus]
MRNITLHHVWLTFMPAYEGTVGTVTLILSALAFYLMIKKTPQSAKPFAKYLMLLQASITLVDINYGFLFCSVTLFPAPAGLCFGILCTWFGFSGHTGVVLMYFSLLSVLASITYCFHYKYVCIRKIAGRDSLEASRHSLFRVVVFVICMIPGVVQIGNSRDQDAGPLYI